MIIPDWIAALEYPSMGWIAVGVLCATALFVAWGIFKIGGDADDYDADHLPQRYLDSLKRGDDDRDPPAGAA